MHRITIAISTIRTLVVVILLAALASTGVHAVQKVEWKNLLPQLPPLQDPLSSLTQDQRFDIETISWARELKGEELKLIQNKQGIKDAKKYEKRFQKASVNVDELLAKYTKWQADVELRQKKVNETLNGKQIRMAGYLLPLEFSEQGDTEFLLVPYVGACIHVPPPPANQIVFVRLAKKFKVADLYTAVWITGEMKTKSSSKALNLVDGQAAVTVGYHLEGNLVIPYKR